MVTVADNDDKIRNILTTLGINYDDAAEALADPNVKSQLLGLNDAQINALKVQTAAFKKLGATQGLAQAQGKEIPDISAQEEKIIQQGKNAGTPEQLLRSIAPISETQANTESANAYEKQHPNMDPKSSESQKFFKELGLNTNKIDDGLQGADTNIEKQLLGLNPAQRTALLHMREEVYNNNNCMVIPAPIMPGDSPEEKNRKLHVNDNCTHIPPSEMSEKLMKEAKAAGLDKALSANTMGGVLGLAATDAIDKAYGSTAKSKEKANRGT